MKKKLLRRQRPGLVLLLALLLMAAITASTIGISLVISTSARQSNNLDNFIIASLSADSGLERSLAIVKAGRRTASLTQTVTAANAGASVILGNNSRFGVATNASSVPVSVPELKAGQSFSFDILRPATCPGGGFECTPSDLYVTGGSGSTSTAILDVSWVLIDANGNTNYSGRDFRTYTNFQAASAIIFHLNEVRTENSSAPQQFTGSATLLGYRVTVRAVGGTVTQVTATPWDALQNVAVQIPSNVAITSTGQAGITQSIKTASVLWQLPSSKLFNFAIFTEGPIISCGSLETSC